MITDPVFAVVGHPNKGKSSIVATLVHSDKIEISSRSGTTQHADSYHVETSKGGYKLIDTPGFQRPTKVLRWLKRHCDNASQRAETIKQFVEDAYCREQFPDEVELLRPISEGAAILYVVDGSRPYGVEYEAEMDILRWTGQPSMALINPIESQAYVEEWESALKQFFKAVQVFNPMLADFEHARSLTFVRSNGIHNIKRVSAPTNWRDNRSEVIRIVKDSTPYSGFSLFDFEPDWRSLSHFKFDVFNPEDHTVELNLRINDTHHNNQYLDRFNRVFPLAPGASSITFAIDEVLTLGDPHNAGRTMDISAINRLGFFMTTDYRGDTLYLDNIQGH